ncbi:MAG: Ig-like domain-containing protein [Bacilli bacterium]
MKNIFKRKNIFVTILLSCLFLSSCTLINNTSSESSNTSSEGENSSEVVENKEIKLTLTPTNGNATNSSGYNSTSTTVTAKDSDGNEFDFTYIFGMKFNNYVVQLKASTGCYYNETPISNINKIKVTYTSETLMKIKYGSEMGSYNDYLEIESGEEVDIPLNNHFFYLTTGSKYSRISKIEINYTTGPVEPTIKSISLEETNFRYLSTKSYVSQTNAVVKATWTDKNVTTLDYDPLGVNGYCFVATNSSGTEVDPKNPFNVEGEYEIKAKYKELYSDSVTIYASESLSTPILVKEINLSTLSINVSIDQESPFLVEIVPSYATNKTLSYEIKDPTIASVDQINNTVKGLKIGETELTITSTDGSNVSNSIAITVSDSTYVASSYPYTLKDANMSMGYDSLNPIGEADILIVPVQLSGATSWTSSMLERVRKAFFGTSDDTNYFESVKSFYERASYNKFTLKGEIAPVYQSSYTVTQIKNAGESAIESKIIDEYYSSADATLLKNHDLDSNGHIDTTIFLYSNNYDGDNFWAWVWYLNGTNTNKTKPTIGTYMWASYNFMNDGLSSSETSTKVDAHTYIHEFGHVLGLDDYYCYDDNGWDPVGTSEMQSYNVGDQSIFSKVQLGWANPQVIKKGTSTVDIKLKTSALYNDAILISDEWNGSPMDEYILVELYTPKGNNLTDSQTAYSNGVKMYTTSGLRIYHADARLVRLTSASSTSSTYSDTIKDDAIYFTGASNSTSWSYLKSPYNSTYRLVQLMQANVTSSTSSNHFKNGGKNTNDTLYGLNQTFQASSVFFANGTKFNDGTEVGYSITMISLQDEECTVRITKI